ncbi:MAG TPA: hypothetical protein VJT09_12640 [Pyrinomonadaceae bacterium]|nr:hypothetical protein [Pyrinomonadaceae bacterium]
MSLAHGIHTVEAMIGRAVLSRATANKLGQTHDLLIDPVRGELAGLSLRMIDGSLRLVDYREIYSFGQDAVMINSDEAALPVQDSPLKALPLAKYNLVGANVITGDGKLLGQVANVYLRLAETVCLIYEVRSSILDKLLGHALYFPASEGQAISGDFTRLVVADDTAGKAQHSLEALAGQLFVPPREDPVIVVRSRSH